jgi:hypothetical protein
MSTRPWRKASPASSATAGKQALRARPRQIRVICARLPVAGFHWAAPPRLRRLAEAFEHFSALRSFMTSMLSSVEPPIWKPTFPAFDRTVPGADPPGR